MSFPIHFVLLFCVVCFTPMRFPRLKADGQSFYHCVSRVVDRRFIFQTAGPTVLPRRKDLCYLCDGWRPFATYGS